MEYLALYLPDGRAITAPPGAPQSAHLPYDYSFVFKVMGSVIILLIAGYFVMKRHGKQKKKR